MKIAITTFYSPNYEPLAALTIPPLQKYCDKHGYFLNINKIEDGNKHHFVKTKDARRLLDEYDVVMAIENDLLITNLSYTIEGFTHYERCFSLCKDINNYNGGCFIVRDDLGKSWLDFVNSFEGLLGDEQNVMERYCGSDLFIHMIDVLPHPAINSIPYSYYHNYGYINYNGQPKPTHEQGNWRIGDWCCHLPGQTLEKRIEIFNEIKHHIIYE